MSQLAAGETIGPYRVAGLLGRGGMATVYLATHETLGRPAALKLLDPRLGAEPAFVERFAREGRMQAALEHPHVVAVYETLESGHGLVIAMQLVRGPTLAALIAAGALTGGRALAILGQVAEAIDAAHAAGLVHRDVKSRNVLVADGDHAYLADFGLTRLGDETGVSATGELVGTVAYLAPEVARGEPATAASDRYAFAALAFEALTGSVVFPRPTQAAQLYAHTTEPVPQISTRRPELPAALDAVFERALAKAPADRPRSAAELVRAIRAAIGDELLETLDPPVPLRVPDGDADTSTASPLPALGSAPSSGQRPWRLAAAAAVVAAVVGVGVALAVDGDDDDEAVAAVVPAPLRGATVLGSDLSQPGSTRDCDGRAVRPASAECTVLQTRLPERAVVVPGDGVIRRWAVRSARGELQLQVLRLRDGQYFQIAVSQNEFVADGQVHAFPTDLAVEAGDVLGVHVVSGSGVGVRERDGTATRRWVPRLRGVGTPPSARARGLDGELLLRAEHVRGARQRLPKQVTGSAAAALPAGRVVRRRLARPPGLRAFDLRIVDVDGRYVLDSFLRGRRLARLDLPGFLAGLGEITGFDTFVNEGDPNVEVSLEYRRAGSVRVLSHYVLALPRELLYIN